MMSPYKNLPADRFWSTGVAAQHPLTVEGLYVKRFTIAPTDRIATAGSCFAQHIARYLRSAGYRVPDFEPAPYGMSAESARNFGYGVYSARFGNIYLARQLLQLVEEAASGRVRTDIVWQKDGRYYDALRPGVEPGGLASPEEVLAHREGHIKAVLRMFREVDLFVFTFGLTEGWVHAPTGLVYPTCPGTIAGSFDPETHAFKNFTFQEIHADFVSFRELVLGLNPRLRFLVTVSPVPLKATASGRHVLIANTYSKSTLRAVAGQLFDEFADIEYFPSYEIIASSWSKGFFYGPDQREVTPGGVDAVMRVFFEQHPPPPRRGNGQPAPKPSAEDVVCEEELLDAFQS